jgi:hypothetical protein
VADYLADSGKRIKAGETLNYGYWLVEFQAVRDDLLEVWEYNAEGTDFVLGGSLALSYWRDQNQVCSQHRAAFCCIQRRFGGPSTRRRAVPDGGAHVGLVPADRQMG